MEILSHIMIAFLNALTFYGSILIIFLSSYGLATTSPDPCNPNYAMKGLLLGTFLFFLSILALVGAVQENRRLLLIYAGVLVAWIVCLLWFSVLLLLVSNMSVPKVPKEHREIELNDYPAWMRRYAVDGNKWTTVKKCMVQQKICKNLHEANGNGSGDLPIGNTFMQYGCCQAPRPCGSVKDPECPLWSDDLDEACYACEKCKVGYLTALRENLLNDAQWTALSSILLVIGFGLAYWAVEQTPHHLPATADSAA